MKADKDYFLRELKIEDGYQLRDWGTFDDPIYYGYEYNDITDKEISYWYKVKTSRFGSEYFSIISPEEKLIGYIGMKEINKLVKTAKLGIVINPDLVSMGYGSSAMEEFLKYVFLEKKMRRIDLEVNSWNIRALRLYEKFGFVKQSETFMEFENQEIDLEDEKYSDFKNDFKYNNNVLYSKIYKMSLHSKDYYDESRD